PPRLRERPLVVVDTQVEGGVGELRVAGVLLDDEGRRGLLATAVAARGLRGGEALDQPLPALEMGVRLERGGQRVDGGFGAQDVPLGRVAVTGAAARPLVARPARERRRAAGAVDDAHLPLVAPLIGRRESLDHLLGRASLA